MARASRVSGRAVTGAAMRFDVPRAMATVPAWGTPPTALNDPPAKRSLPSAVSDHTGLSASGKDVSTKPVEASAAARKAFDSVPMDLKSPPMKMVEPELASA